jgi:hypothetical protein
MINGSLYHILQQNRYAAFNVIACFVSCTGLPDILKPVIMNLSVSTEILTFTKDRRFFPVLNE